MRFCRVLRAKPFDNELAKLLGSSPRGIIHVQHKLDVHAIEHGHRADRVWCIYHGFHELDSVRGLSLRSWAFHADERWRVRQRESQADV